MFSLYVSFPSSYVDLKWESTKYFFVPSLFFHCCYVLSDVVTKIPKIHSTFWINFQVLMGLLILNILKRQSPVLIKITFPHLMVLKLLINSKENFLDVLRWIKILKFFKLLMKNA